MAEHILCESEYREYRHLKENFEEQLEEKMEAHERATHPMKLISLGFLVGLFIGAIIVLGRWVGQ